MICRSGVDDCTLRPVTDQKLQQNFATGRLWREQEYSYPLVRGGFAAR